MRRKALVLFLLAVLTGFIFTSCQKNYTPDQATGNDNTQADNAVADAFFFGLENGQKDFVANDSSCFVRTIDTIEENGILKRRITLTFNNCDVFGNGVIRNGQIIITVEPGWITDANKSLVVTFNNFERDSIKVEGTLTSHFKQLIAEGQPSFVITEDGMKLTFPDNSTFTWSGTRTVEWLAGFGTPRIRNDNKIRVSYDREGVNRKGEHFTATATNIIFDRSCRYHMPISGTLQITKEDGTSFTIDFGSGECDNCLLYSQNGRQVQICGD